jgi:hypothetical protein
MHGRIEHIVSGQATTFDSLAAVLAFVQQVFTAPAAPSPTDAGPSVPPAACGVQGCEYA